MIFFIAFLLITVASSKITSLVGTTAASTSSNHTFPGELEELQSVLHFPEEVALRITDAEYQLFYQVIIGTMKGEWFIDGNLQSNGNFAQKIGTTCGILQTCDIRTSK